jgi:hypothetical protein
MCLTKPGKSRDVSSSRCLNVGANSFERSASVSSGLPEKKLLMAAWKVSARSAKVVLQGVVAVIAVYKCRYAGVGFSCLRGLKTSM